MQAFDHDLRRQSAHASAPEQKRARADWYALLARLLSRPAEAPLLAGLAALAVPAGTVVQGDGAAGANLPRAWHALCVAAGGPPHDIGAEFGRLVVGVNLPPVSVGAVFHQGGHDNQKPLAALRRFVPAQGLGLRYAANHLGALCEAMHLLVDAARPPATQRAFFDAHIGSRYGACLADLRGSAGTGFYAALADLAAAFLAIEARAFALADDGHSEPPSTAGLLI
ncbi:MAG: molecular chaperone TorD family protein [Massilia sp.]